MALLIYELYLATSRMTTKEKATRDPTVRTTLRVLTHGCKAIKSCKTEELLPIKHFINCDS